MSTASQGRAREHKVRNHLAAAGWTPIMRAAASKGPADLLLGHPARGALLVQVGTNKKSLSPADRTRFLDAAYLTRATPVVATVTPRKGIEYRVVTSGTASTWERWER